MTDSDAALPTPSPEVVAADSAAQEGTAARVVRRTPGARRCREARSRRTRGGRG